MNVAGNGSDATTPRAATRVAATLAHDPVIPQSRWIFQPMVAYSETAQRVQKALNGRATLAPMVVEAVAMQAVFAGGRRAVVVASAAAAAGARVSGRLYRGEAEPKTVGAGVGMR